MKKILHILLMSILIAILLSCEKYTDISPKGKNLLNTANDLNLLLNYNYSGNAFFSGLQSMLVNDTYGQFVNVPNSISGPTNLTKILLTYDEKSDRAALTPTDAPYEGLYKIVSSVANIVLTNAETATGDPAMIKQLKAEAFVIRAYMHYLLVNIYAKAYDPATAATDGGIPYVTTINFETLNDKKSVKEVYDNIISDLDQAFALNALPDQPENSMRVGKGFAYAVKAKVLLAMRDYPGALDAANSSLRFNNILEDHRPLLTLPRKDRIFSRIGLTASDNIFYAYQVKNWPLLYSLSYEILNNYYEPGNILKDETNTYDFSAGLLYNGLAGVGVFLSISYEQNAAGLTTSDMYFAKAEVLIRENEIQKGMDIINEIRLRRISPYTPLTASNQAQAMSYLQRAARTEFLFTWRNYFDIKRWNREGKYTVVVERTVNGTKYVLPPNSPLWVFPFPQSATNFNSTLTQNY